MVVRCFVTIKRIHHGTNSSPERRDHAGRPISHAAIHWLAGDCAAIRRQAQASNAALSSDPGINVRPHSSPAVSCNFTIFQCPGARGQQGIIRKTLLAHRCLRSFKGMSSKNVKNKNRYFPCSSALSAGLRILRSFSSVAVSPSAVVEVSW